MTILLGEAHIQGIVALLPKANATGQLHRAMRVFVGKAEHANAPLDAACLEHQVIAPDVGDPDFALDERRVDPESTRARVC